jgi:hypothetical protein
MQTIRVDLKGLSPIGFSAPVASIKSDKDTHDEFEKKTWREKMHVDNDGMVFIPPMALKNCLASIAAYRSEKIPGRGQSKFTKHFVAGVLVPEPMPLGIKADTVQSQRVFVPSDGKRGGGTRVWRMFPVIPEWSTTATIVLLDDLLEAHVKKVEEYLRSAGQLVGLGWFRPERNGYYGRFEVTKFDIVS